LEPASSHRRPRRQRGRGLGSEWASPRVSVESPRPVAGLRDAARRLATDTDLAGARRAHKPLVVAAAAVIGLLVVKRDSRPKGGVMGRRGAHLTIMLLLVLGVVAAGCAKRPATTSVAAPPPSAPAPAAPPATPAPAPSTPAAAAPVPSTPSTPAPAPAPAATTSWSSPADVPRRLREAEDRAPPRAAPDRRRLRRRRRGDRRRDAAGRLPAPLGGRPGPADGPAREDGARRPLRPTRPSRARPADGGRASERRGNAA